MELKYHTISEEESPISSLSPGSSKNHSPVVYHEYDFIPQARQVDSIEGPSSQRDSVHVTPLFYPPTTTRDSNDDELPPPSTPRSSSGSSTFYNEGSQEESDLPIVKSTLSVAFPSPTLQHRLSEWLSRSNSQIQACNPQHGGRHRNADSPTLGFSWNDFSLEAEKTMIKGEGDTQYGRRRAYTDGSLASTYVDGGYNLDLEKDPVPASEAYYIDVGVAI